VSRSFLQSSDVQARSTGVFRLRDAWPTGERTVDILGIDVSKKDFHAALMQGSHVAKKSFPNSPKGFEQLVTWLVNRKAGHVFACMEATGAYWEALATYLHDAGHQVAVVNPRRIKAFGESELVRTKTDATDAALIARFAATQQPSVWQPLPVEIRELQGLARHLEFLKGSRAQHLTRAQTPGLPAAVQKSEKQIIAEFDTQIQRFERAVRDHIDRHPGLKAKRELLDSIPGIGDVSAAVILSEVPTIEEFRNGQAVAAYAGLCPREHQSGVFRGKTTLSKIGNRRLRKALFFPAMVAKTHNPTMRAFAEKLRAAGKPKMAIIGALMRKLLVLAYGVLKSGRPYDPAFTPSRP
jgi:transposase